MPFPNPAPAVLIGLVLAAGNAHAQADGSASPDCGPAAVAEALQSLFPPAADEVRAGSARLLAACKVSGAAGALRAALEHDKAPPVQAEALRALDGLGQTPGRRALEWLAWYGAPDVAAAAAVILDRTTLKPPPQPVARVAAPPPAGPRLSVVPPAPTALRSPRTSQAALAPAVAKPPDAPRGPLPGTPLAIGASTVAGAALMRNLGLMGGQGLADATPQLLLGTAGAVIGFGTSWGLARFGLRPTLEQAAWFANVTAWGTLAGLTAWSASGSTSPKLQYGALVLGQAAGMGLGVWSARRWRWTAPQIALADSFVLGSGLSMLGIRLMREENPQVTATEAVAAPVVMLAAAIAARQLDVTRNDLRLMGAMAVAGAWTGGLLAAGGFDADVFTSRESTGGAIAGVGLGYLAGAAAAAFTEVDSYRLGEAAGGLAAGNVLGLGLHLTFQGFTHDNSVGAAFTSAEVSRRALSAAIGGAVLAGAAYAAAPRLRLGSSALPVTFAGAGYGAGTWWLASAAGHDGRALNDVDHARLEGGMITGAVLGGVAGLLAAQRFTPDAVAHATAAAATGLGISAGLGVARLTTDVKGAPDSVGVMLGAAAGLTAGAWTTHATRLRLHDGAAGLAGAAYGALVGALVPSLGDQSWNDGRVTAGGALLGIGVGGGGATAAAHLLRATGGQVASPAIAGALGLGIGVGAGQLLPCDASTGCSSQGSRIGAVAGSVTLMAGALALDPVLHLSRGVGEAAPQMALSGAAFGAVWGMLGAAALDPSGLVATTPARQIQGGALMGASAGVASGLVLSRWYTPPAEAIGLTFAGSAAGGALGLGIAQLAREQAGRADTLGMLTGSSGGMLAGALVAPHLTLRPVDRGAAVLGLAGGGLVGTLAPSLADDDWASERRATGGALTGAALGGAGALGAAVATQASSSQVAVVTVGGGLGAGAGLGVGLLWNTQTSRAERIGTVAGIAGGLGLGLLGDVALHLDRGLGPDANALAARAVAYGIADGLLLAGAIDSSGLIARTPSDRLWGGVLTLTSVELGTALALSRYVRLRDGSALVLDGGKAAGGALGLGVAMLARPETGRVDTVATLAGSMAGLGGAALAEAYAPLTSADSAGMATGLGFGGFLGVLAPTLGDEAWGGMDRRGVGGLLVGASAGAVGGAALRHATGATRRTVGLTALGGADGLITGLGFGLLVTSEKDDGDGAERMGAERIGMFAGTVAGLGIGALAWPRLELGVGGTTFIVAATALGGWTGGWIPSLGHATSDDVSTTRTAGGVLAGAGVASIGASLLAPALQPDPDLIINASALHALWTGAGAGAGVLFSDRLDAPVWGMLGAGTAGLVLGGALHDGIALDSQDAPLLALAGAEGLWLGGWLPNLLYDGGDVTASQRAGGLALGGLGALGLATVTSGALTVSPAQAGTAAAASAAGASIAGGLVLLTPEPHGRAGTGAMLAGTGIGLLAGAALAPRLSLIPFGTTVAAASAGTALGLSEALLFAWSARATTRDQYTGAALLGGGIGATLGIAAGAALGDGSGSAPAAAGFAAWGAWMGAFAGALVKDDAHEVVLGGLTGANLGFLGGYALLRSGAVDARDFGWLSLFGALGTVAGAGAGAPFSSRSDPAPVLAGLAAGPAVGMLAGALVLPRLRTMAGPGAPAAIALRRARTGAARALGLGAAPAPTASAGGEERLSLSTGILDAADGLDTSTSFLRRLAQVVQITDWSPLVGALPTAEPSGPPPLLFGLTGLWR